MKVLLFTHKSDIDGLGNLVLAKLSFDEVQYVLCRNRNELQEEVENYLKDNKLYEYDKIFITDLSLQEPTLTKIAQDNKLKDKIIICDHHESAIEEGLNKYDFSNIIVEKDNIKTCATTVFYDYLSKNNYLTKNKCLDRFTEMTRREDNYEFKKYNDQSSHDLAILFMALGPEKYTERILEKIKLHEEFNLDEDDYSIINNRKKELKEKVLLFIKDMYIKEISNLKIGFIFIDYDARNEVSDYLINNNSKELDAVGMIALDNNQISFRALKEVNIRKIAESLGGGGHDKAAASPITSDQKQDLIKYLIDKNR